MTYTLWVGSDVGEIHNLTLRAPKNETFYEVMVLAAQRSSDFQFSAYEWPNGHYVHTLGGYKEEPMSYHYWLLYRLPSPPEPSSPPGNQFVAPGGGSPLGGKGLKLGIMDFDEALGNGLGHDEIFTVEGATLKML